MASKSSDDTGVGVSFFGLLVATITITAWFTHLYRCFTEESWGFLIAGALFFPIAVFHGFGIWFGIW